MESREKFEEENKIGDMSFNQYEEISSGKRL